MIVARIKAYAKRGINWWRRRREIAARLTRLEQEVYALRNRLEVASAFYERRLDAALKLAAEKEQNSTNKSIEK